MTNLPPIGALWIGGSLTWLEQLCLKSFVAHGHQTLLYTYGEVRNVPEGVEIRDGRDVLDTDQFILHERTQSVALFSDLFRFHMIRQNPKIIYVDTDVLCLKPFDFEDEFLFGYEKPNGLNGAVLRLPAHSKILEKMLAFMEETHPKPNWIAPKIQTEMHRRAAEGDPMHVSEFPWGIWGPIGLTAFARETGEISHAKPVDVFYPLPFKERRMLLRRPMKTLTYLTDNTHAIHLWAPIKRLAASRHDGLCPPNSYVGKALADYGIDPEQARVPTTAKREVTYD